MGTFGERSAAGEERKKKKKKKKHRSVFRKRGETHLVEDVWEGVDLPKGKGKEALLSRGKKKSRHSKEKGYASLITEKGKKGLPKDQDFLFM